MPDLPGSLDGPIDRIAPSRRPDRRHVMYQTWSTLLFLHWEVSVETLRPLVPAELDLDTYNGRAYVGIVPFTMSGVRPVYLPSVPWLSSFHETNVRTYVHRQGKDPGVWFFSLEAANPVAVALARSLFCLPYHHARMRLQQSEDGPLRYASWRLWPGPIPAVSDIRARPLGNPAPATPGTFDHFVLERYYLYAKRGARLYRGHVHHRPYPAQSAEVYSVDETLLSACGIERPAGPPIGHFSRGVHVEIFPLETVVTS
ncbi:MAG: DUF2071 domain-containing protein [Isosphaeraceae bacterium]